MKTPFEWTMRIGLWAVLAGTALHQLATPGEAWQSEAPVRNWDLFRGDASGTGYTDEELPGKPEVIWEYAVDRGAFESTAVIHDGVVYIGDLDGKLFALDLEKGILQWEFSTDIGFVAAPAFRDGRIYVGNLDGYFFCLDARDGTEVWKFESNASIDAGANFYQDNVIFGSQDASLYCLNAASGEIVWQFTLDDQIRCSPTIVENRAFVAGCDGQLHIVDLDQGVSAGSVPIDSPTGVTPAVLGDVTCFGTEQAGFYAVDWKKHVVNWQFLDPDGVASTRSSPAVTPEHVVFGSRNRKVVSLNPADGSVNWSFEARGPVDSSPVIAGNRVYVGSDDGRLYVLNLADGSLVSEKELNGKIIGSPAVSRSRLIVATSRGLVYCLGEINP